MSTVELRQSPGSSLVTLYVDGVESSALDTADPSHLEFEYMQQMRIAIDARYPAAAPIRALHLGAAGCALPRALDADRPNSRQLAIEIDPELAQLAREWFDLPPSPRLRIRSEDARRTLDTNKGSWQVIVRDAFRGGRIPNQLATIEAHQQAARLLTEDGIYLLNIAGEAGLTPVYREVRALAPSFEHILGISDPAIMRGRRFGNVVLVASHAPLDTQEIERHVRRLPLPTVVVSHAKLMTGGKSTEPLTDAEIGWPGEG